MLQRGMGGDPAECSGLSSGSEQHGGVLADRTGKLEGAWLSRMARACGARLDNLGPA